jgi:hypothetical protein
VRVVRFFEMRADSEDSAVDARLCFAVEARPVMKPLKHQPLVNAVDHFARLLTGGIKTEVFQSVERVQGDQQVSVSLRQIVSPAGRTAAPTARRRLGGEKLGAPTFGCDARPLGCNRVRRVIGEVPHDLPADGRIRIQEPFEVRGPGGVNG